MANKTTVGRLAKYPNKALTFFLCALGSDTIANGSGDAAITGPTGGFSFNVTEPLIGWYDLLAFEGSTLRGVGLVHYPDDVAGTYIVDDPNGLDPTSIAGSVFSQLAGSRTVLLNGPVSASGPVDQVKTVDLLLTIPVIVSSTSELLWFMRCHPDASTAYLVASKSVGLTQLMTNTSPTANQASITRNADNVVVKIKAAALSQLPSETVACELREVTQSSDTLSRYEVEITLRHSAGR